MDIARALLAADGSPTDPFPTAPADQPVPLLRFLAGTCRAAIALLRFCAGVARERSLDPILLEPRILRVAA